ncbi:MAG: bis-aminopropyl spermidine synthase family protein [Candidatus Eremiobacteraeota bacterium]|nr:bis-aminopropyl spermidine synthase family protein [Candidatus Eremiobacteraeota bacterium]
MSRLVGEPLGETPAEPYSGPEFWQRVERLLHIHRSQRRPASLKNEAAFHRWVLRYGLRMAGHSYDRLDHPPPTPPADWTQAFSQLLPAPPPESELYAQGRIDLDSTWRRAQRLAFHLAPGASVLFLGDDDATSIALSLLDRYAIAVVDLDPRVLDWLGQSGLPLELEQADVRSLPRRFQQAFEAVVIDPAREATLGAAFVRAALACLAPGGLLGWSDHPDWNHAYPKLDGLLSGLELVEEQPCWHRYAIAYWDDSTAHFHGLDPDWMRRLCQSIALWSNLRLLRG